LVESLLALIDWIEERAAWLRPALYGALLVPAWAFKEGALLVLPLVIIGVLATAEQPLRTLGFGLLVLILAVAGASLSGLVYSFVGRHVRQTPVIGSDWFR
jgi:hypothetical protein